MTVELKQYFVSPNTSKSLTRSTNHGSACASPGPRLDLEWASNGPQLDSPEAKSHSHQLCERHNAASELQCTGDYAARTAACVPSQRIVPSAAAVRVPRCSLACSRTASAVLAHECTQPSRSPTTKRGRPSETSLADGQSKIPARRANIIGCGFDQSCTEDMPKDPAVTEPRLRAVRVILVITMLAILQHCSPRISSAARLVDAVGSLLGFIAVSHHTETNSPPATPDSRQQLR